MVRERIKGVTGNQCSKGRYSYSSNIEEKSERVSELGGGRYKGKLNMFTLGSLFPGEAEGSRIVKQVLGAQVTAKVW